MRVDYTNEQGFKYLVEVPAGFEDEPELGVIVGPPDIEPLELPEKYAVRLNNQLFDRKLFTWADVRRRPEEIRAVLKTVFRVDELAIVKIFKEEMNNGNAV